MTIEIRAVGGYGEVGRNMTAVRINDSVIIFDMGLHLPNYIRYTEEEGEEVIRLSADELIRAKAAPDDSIIDDWKGMVKAIIPTHAHLDHIGAIPYMAAQYNAPIICTPYTAAVLNAILRDEKLKIPNKIKTLLPNSSCKLSPELTVEFINMTHSTPQTVSVAVHSAEGTVLYANDFKLDRHPPLGKKPNYELLKKIGKKGVRVAIVDSLYADRAMKTPSESVAKEMLQDVLLGVDSRGKAVIVTTFSSHIARLLSIAEFGRQLNRKVVFLGRSLSKYVHAAEETGIAHFPNVEIVSFSVAVGKKLKEIEKKGAEHYLLAVTGHQGEPKSVLSKMASKILPFRFCSGDQVVFSCTVIPTQINRGYRENLERELKNYGVRIFKDIHVSGHASREDLRDMLQLVNPEHIIPAHSEPVGMDAFIELGEELGYKKGRTAHPLLNSQSLIIQ